jgi:hypothetical protein
LVDSGQAYWRVEKATRAALIVDADEYFEAARAAMLKAKRRIILVGWDFDARISLIRRLMPSDATPSRGLHAERQPHAAR